MNSTNLSQKFDNASAARRTVKPEFTVTTIKDAYTVQIFVPGSTRADTKITLEDNVLTFEATRNTAVPENWRPIRRERHQVNYRLRLNLGRDVDTSRIQAEVADGVLTLTLPKAEEVKPRQIEIA